MKKELKRQIREDEFVSGLGRALSWIDAHRDETRVTAIALAVVAFGGVALAYYQSARTRDARQEFEAALEVFHAPVTSEIPAGEKPATPGFASAAEKYRKAAAAFDGVERRFGSTVEGVRARYYGALCRIEIGGEQEREQARKALQDVAGRRERPLESGLAKLALADMLRRDGQVDLAVGAYKALAEDLTAQVPRDATLMRIAEALDEAHRSSEARDAYKRLVDEFPGSVFASEARQRAAYLGNGA